MNEELSSFEKKPEELDNLIREQINQIEGLSDEERKKAERQIRDMLNVAREISDILGGSEG